MNKKDKKKKAAVAAVLAYLDKTKEQKHENRWVKLGRVIIMRNNIMVQTKNLKR